WVNRDEELKVMHENGPGSSPVIVGDKLIFHLDGSDRQSIAALNKSDGTLAWMTKRSGEMNANPQLQKAYGTPLVLGGGAGAQVISNAADWLYAYDPATGAELWRAPYEKLGFSNVARPVFGGGMIYLATGFMKSEIIAFRYDGKAAPAPEWRYSRNCPCMTSPILAGDELYIVDDNGGMLTCLNAKTGEDHYRERLGGNHSAAPTYAGGHLYFHSREGETTVIKPGPKFEVVSKNQLDGQIFASLAASGKALYLRTDKALYRIEEN
ncbi:MAG: PQQ-binding-like beta-propeller repeat protein, partial [Verrucomicrobiales bacterium]